MTELVFYYALGSSSLAAHLVLAEAGARYRAVEVPIGAGAHRRADFLKLAPKGRIPVLQTPQGVLTETPSLLEYIAETHPEAGLLPPSRAGRAQARSLSTYLSATVHVAYAHFKRPERWIDDARAQDSLRRHAPGQLLACAKLLDQQFGAGPWALGNQFSYVDAQVFLLAHWLRETGGAVADFPALHAHHWAVTRRPKLAEVLALYGW